jgi:hypothetical protein
MALLFRPLLLATGSGEGGAGVPASLPDETPSTSILNNLFPHYNEISQQTNMEF